MDGRSPGLGAVFGQVLTAAQAGAGWACTRLYEWLAPAVAGYARSQGIADADDLTSEVFLAVFSRLATFTGGEAQFRSWVFTIAYRRIVDHRRAGARRPRTEPLEGRADERTDHAVGAGSHAGGTTTEEQALATLGTERVLGLLERLSPDQRDVIALRVVADLTLEQVAEALGKQEGAVKSLQHRALAALRRHVTAEAVSP